MLFSFQRFFQHVSIWQVMQDNDKLRLHLPKMETSANPHFLIFQNQDSISTQPGSARIAGRLKEMKDAKTYWQSRKQQT
jgi:hypothetical protein